MRNTDFSVCALSDHPDQAGCGSIVKVSEGRIILTGFSNGPLRGLSRVRQKSHARFWGDGGVAMRRCYPLCLLIRMLIAPFSRGNPAPIYFVLLFSCLDPALSSISAHLVLHQGVTTGWKPFLLSNWQHWPHRFRLF